MTVTTLDTSTSPLPATQGGTNATSFSSAYINLLNTASFSNTATILTSTAYGQTCIFDTTGSYSSGAVTQITLPAAQAGKTIRFIFNNAGTYSYKIVPPSGTINGQSQVYYGAAEGCELYTDGTNWWTISQCLMPVFWNVYNNANQTVTAGAAPQLAFNTVTYSSAVTLDGSNNLYPHYVGTYNFSCEQGPNVIATTNNESQLFINDDLGTIFCQGSTWLSTSAANTAQITTTGQGFVGKTRYLICAYRNNDSVSVTLDNLPRWSFRGNRIANF